MADERGSKRVNFADPSSAATVLEALRTEADGFLELATKASADDWLTDSACTGWATRDVVGHLVDVTQTYVARYEMALRGWPAPEPLGMDTYSDAINRGATSFRDLPQFELIGRLKGPSDHLFAVFDGLTADQWAGLTVHHKYAGPLPSFMMVMFQLLDYTFHSWDIKKGLGRDAHLGEGAAGILASLMPSLLQMSFAADRAGSGPFKIGIDVGGPYGATYVASYADGAFQIEDGDISAVSTVIGYADAEAFCLENFGREITGTVRGDTALGERFKTLFNWL